jgi:pimeloyl-ACP methyl ester carboxylesterase
MKGGRTSDQMTGRNPLSRRRRWCSWSVGGGLRLGANYGNIETWPSGLREYDRSELLDSKEVLRMTTYVLVGGGWLGGWCWQPVVRRLRENGHDAYPVTLTGLGERVHLASPQVDLDTHITDVANLVEFEDLRDIVLLGHSYGGIVVTGAVI